MNTRQTPDNRRYGTTVRLGAPALAAAFMFALSLPVTADHEFEHCVDRMLDLGIPVDIAEFECGLLIEHDPVDGGGHIGIGDPPATAQEHLGIIFDPLHDPARIEIDLGGQPAEVTVTVDPVHDPPVHDPAGDFSHTPGWMGGPSNTWPTPIQEPPDPDSDPDDQLTMQFFHGELLLMDFNQGMPILSTYVGTMRFEVELRPTPIQEPPDPYGRIKVQFHWEREHCRDEVDTDWIRTVEADWPMPPPDPFADPVPPDPDIVSDTTTRVLEDGRVITRTDTGPTSYRERIEYPDGRVIFRTRTVLEDGTVITRDTPKEPGGPLFHTVERIEYPDGRVVDGRIMAITMHPLNMPPLTPPAQTQPRSLRELGEELDRRRAEAEARYGGEPTAGDTAAEGREIDLDYIRSLAEQRLVDPDTSVPDAASDSDAVPDGLDPVREAIGEAVAEIAAHQQFQREVNDGIPPSLRTARADGTLTGAEQSALDEYHRAADAYYAAQRDAARADAEAADARDSADQADRAVEDAEREKQDIDRRRQTIRDQIDDLSKQRDDAKNAADGYAAAAREAFERGLQDTYRENNDAAIRKDREAADLERDIDRLHGELSNLDSASQQADQDIRNARQTAAQAHRNAAGAQQNADAMQQRLDRARADGQAAADRLEQAGAARAERDRAAAREAHDRAVREEADRRAAIARERANAEAAAQAVAAREQARREETAYLVDLMAELGIVSLDQTPEEQRSLLVEWFIIVGREAAEGQAVRVPIPVDTINVIAGVYAIVLAERDPRTGPGYERAMELLTSPPHNLPPEYANQVVQKMRRMLNQMAGAQ